MREYLPLLIAGAIIGAFTLAFVIAYASIKDKKTAVGFERNMADSEIVRRLLGYAKPYWKDFVLVFFVMLLSIAYDIISPWLIGEIQNVVKADFEINTLLSMVVVYAGILLVSITRGTRTEIPSGMSSFYPGDIVVVVTGRGNVIHQLGDIFA